MKRVELYGGNYQEINFEDRIVTTVFADGSRLHAAAEVTEESVARAKALGYQGSDEGVVWEMTLDHDRIHMLLAQAEGLEFSHTLWAVANDIPWKGEMEERRVFFATRLMNEGRGGL